MIPSFNMGRTEGLSWIGCFTSPMAPIACSFTQLDEGRSHQYVGVVQRVTADGLVIQIQRFTSRGSCGADSEHQKIVHPVRLDEIIFIYKRETRRTGFFDHQS